MTRIVGFKLNKWAQALLTWSSFAFQTGGLTPAS